MMPYNVEGKALTRDEAMAAMVDAGGPRPDALRMIELSIALALWNRAVYDSQIAALEASKAKDGDAFDAAMDQMEVAQKKFMAVQDEADALVKAQQAAKAAAKSALGEFDEANVQ